MRHTIFILISLFLSTHLSAQPKFPKEFSHESIYSLDYLSVKPNGERKAISSGANQYVFIPTFIEKEAHSPSRAGLKLNPTTKIILKKVKDKTNAIYVLDGEEHIEINIEIKKWQPGNDIYDSEEDE